MFYYLTLIFISCCVFQPLLANDSNNCNVRIYPNGQVCVCNSTYCDTVPEIGALQTDEYEIYTTSKDVLGFSKFLGNFTIDDNVTANIIVNISETYQTIIGFGGSFSDSTGININSLPSEAQANLLNSYFGENGIGYNVARVPVGGTDFSIRGYSYDDDVEEDLTLEHFQLQDEDLHYKIPYILKAKELRNEKQLNLFASSWSSPRWMKTNNDWGGIGLLKSKYYQLWADYFVKFFEEYEKQNITFWGVTTQNEPGDCLFPLTLNCVGWLPSQINRWIRDNFGPTIRNSSFKDLKIILHDDIRLTLPFYLPKILNDDETLSYADGIGLHWYGNLISSSQLLNFAHSDKKDLFLLGTEASTGYMNVVGLEPAILLGSWWRGERYATDIINNLKNNFSGWVDWNMVLDLDGGPTYINNNLDAPIIVNASSGEFYKQSMFYVMGHFSKFIIPESQRLGILTNFEENNDLSIVAFLRPDNLIALVLHNKGDSDVNVNVKSNEKNARLLVGAKSINTMLFRQHFIEI